MRERIAALRARVLPFVGEDRADAIARDFEGSDAVGTPEQIAERLAERAKHGLGYAIHYFPDSAYDTSSQELFESEGHPGARLSAARRAPRFRAARRPRRSRPG